MTPIAATETYRRCSALPPSAVIKVQLVDRVARVDAPAIVLGEQIIQASEKQMPGAFEIPYVSGAVRFEPYLRGAGAHRGRGPRRVEDPGACIPDRGHR